MASARALGGPVPTSRASYIGKGRGRGKLTAKDGAAGDGTRQPGAHATSAADQGAQLTGVARVLQLIKTAPSSVSPQTLAEVVSKEAEANINTGDEVTELAQSLYRWSLQASERAKNTALACNALGGLERDNVKFRSPFLKILKKDYDNRDDLDEESWLPLACLVCQFFKEFKVQGNRIIALEDPALNCILLLLDCDSTESHKCGVEQLCELGPILYPKNSNKIDDIMNDLRGRLLASETESASRVRFLEALECYAAGWQRDDAAVDYYTNKKSGI